MSLIACSASVAFSPAQANCLSLGETNSSQLVINTFIYHYPKRSQYYMLWKNGISLNLNICFLSKLKSSESTIGNQTSNTTRCQLPTLHRNVEWSEKTTRNMSLQFKLLILKSKMTVRKKAVQRSCRKCLMPIKSHPIPRGEGCLVVSKLKDDEQIGLLKKQQERKAEDDMVNKRKQRQVETELCQAQFKWGSRSSSIYKINWGRLPFTK